MCGIAGFFDPRCSLAPAEARARLDGMTGAIQHRGPDAFGIAVEETGTGAVWAGLGHRRLPCRLGRILRLDSRHPARCCPASPGIADRCGLSGNG